MAHSEFMIKKFPLSPFLSSSYLLFPLSQVWKTASWLDWVVGVVSYTVSLFLARAFLLYNTVELVFVFKPRRGCESRFFYIYPRKSCSLQ